METNKLEKTVSKVQEYRSTLELSIRRKNQETGLPGDDPTAQNLRIGSSLKGKGPLSGLTYDEEKKYLPEIINLSPTDNEWRREVKEYWNNISERVPHDSEGTNSRLPGRLIKFTVIFNNEKDKLDFEKAQDFETKAEISKKGLVLPEDVADYVLFRYCLVYARVSNNKKDMYKSAKIDFYLYSQEVEIKKKYTLFQQQTRARNLFVSILDDSNKIDAIMRMFGENPDDDFTYPHKEDKHLKIDELISKEPARFINYANDKSLKEKALISKALELNILFKPANTQSYYFGKDKDLLLGNTLEETVLFLKKDEPKNKQVLESLESSLMFYKS